MKKWPWSISNLKDLKETFHCIAKSQTLLWYGEWLHLLQYRGKSKTGWDYPCLSYQTSSLEQWSLQTGVMTIHPLCNRIAVHALVLSCLKLFMSFSRFEWHPWQDDLHFLFNCGIENAQKLMLFTYLFQLTCHGDVRHKKIKMDQKGWGRRQHSMPNRWHSRDRICH